MDKFMELVTPRKTIICKNEKELRGLCRLLANRGFTCMKSNANPFQLVHLVSERNYPVQIGIFVSGNGIKYNQCYITTTTALEFTSMKEIRAILRASTNSTREWVRDNMPEAWLQAAREFKCQEEMIRRICATVPTIYRNRFRSKEAKNYIMKRVFGVKTHIRHLIDMSDADIVKWNKVGDFIINYEESCR